MSEKTREVSQLADATYAHTVETTGFTDHRMTSVFMSTFDNQSMSIGCVSKLKHLSGFLRHYLLKS